MKLFNFIVRKREPRTIFIGDVHGCLHELKKLVGQLRISDNDHVIMLGDLINRGPDPAGCIQFVYENQFDCVMGNHEMEYLLEYKTVQKHKDLHHELGTELHEWIEKRPLYIETENFMAVHAGLEPGKHPSESRPEILLNIRTWDESSGDIKNPDNPAWYEFYNESKPVFYGHWTRQGLTLRENTFGLDSGCVYGRKLSAFILETQKLVQQEAARVYYIPPALRGNTAAISR